MTGTFGGALEAREIPAGEKRLVAEAIGEIEKVDNVLVLKRIHIAYRLILTPDKHEAAKRAYSIHMENCPSARSIGDCVVITTSLEMEDLVEEG
jgi:uncharacterized OsmC-like protein